jgi:hypothetical protein
MIDCNLTQRDLNTEAIKTVTTTASLPPRCATKNRVCATQSVQKIPGREDDIGV